MSEIDKVFVFNKAGIPFVMYDFNNNKVIVETMLISGFLSAINNFSKEIFKGLSTHLVIESGEDKITLFKGDEIVIATISKKGLLHLKTKFIDLIEFFQNKYGIELVDLKSPEYYNAFRRKLVRVLFYLPIAKDWVPVILKECDKLDEIKSEFMVIRSIDGKKDVQTLTNECNGIETEVDEILNCGYHESVIGFENMFESKDYICSTEKFDEILNNEMEYKKLKSEFSSISIIKFAQNIEDIVRIHQLETNFGRNIIKIIERFYSIGLIEILSEDMAKGIVTVDVVKDFIGMINSLVKFKNVSKIIINILSELDSPELYRRIEIKSDSIKVHKKGIIDYLIENKDIDSYIDLWFSFLDKLIDATYSKVKNKANLLMFEHLSNYYLSNIHDNEMEILDRILLKFEQKST